MRGRIGAWTFQKGRGSISMHYCTKKEKPAKGGQIPQRQKYKDASDKWKDLPKSQQVHLQEFCDVNLLSYSGFNLFVEACVTLPGSRLYIDDLDPVTNKRYVVVAAGHPLLKYVKLMNEAETVTYWESGVPLEG